MRGRCRRRGCAAVGAIVATLVGGCGGCGGGHHRAPPPTAATSTATPTTTAPAARPARRARTGIKGPNGGLAIGLSEVNPSLLAPPSTPVPAGFRAARDALSALRPAYIRVDLDWAALQPRPGSPPNFALPASGCLRGAGPCAAYDGVRDELRAIASQQRAGAGFQPVIVIYGVPAWAARPASGCERSGTIAASRPVTAAGLTAYRSLVLSLIDLGRSEGVPLRWWSPWDEPNHPFFISPQRAVCSTASPAVSPATYTTLAEALASALRAAGGQRHLVLGDLADFPRPRAQGASIGELVAGLPGQLICQASAWAVHEYPSATAPGGTPGGVRALEQALARRGACGQRARIWVTETGAGNPHVSGRRVTTLAGLVAECRLMNRALLTWYGDPRVDVAFQYSFREDSLFPVGLATPGLDALYPTYYLWRAWGGRRAPSAPPPSLPPQCG